MSYRSEPTLAEVKAEVDRILPLAKEMLPIRWRVASAVVVRRIDNEATLADIDFDRGADGGDAVQIRISTFKLDRCGDWKTAVLTRLVHELFHARIKDADDVISKEIKGERLAGLLEFLIEDSAEAIESVVQYFANRLDS